MNSLDAIEQFQVDTGPILQFLLRNDPEIQPIGYQEALESYLPPETWLTSGDSVPYTDISTYQNLFNSEMGSSFRSFLRDKGVSVEDYAGILGNVQYNVIRSQLKSVFPNRNGTRGWKLVLLGFPSIRLVVFAIGHHFGDTRKQGLLGEASGRLRSMAIDHLSSDLVARIEYPAAVPDDWDNSGLMPRPIYSIGGFDISEFDEGAGAKLRFIRNTSAKKEISTFFFRHSLMESDLEVLRPEGSISEGMREADYHLAILRQIARELGRSAA